jgi:iron complex outermembrane recepter protein
MALLMAASGAEAASAEEQERDRREVIVVTGVREEQIASETRVGLLGNTDPFSTPFNVKGYSADLIRDQGARSVNDILASDPSVRVSLSPTFVLDQSSIRGFLVVGSSYLIDNLPNLTPNYGTMPVSHFERVDIFKGPASALTAAVGTVGGTINLAPKRAIDTPVRSTTVSLHDGLLAGGHVDVGRRFGDDNVFGIRINVSGESGNLYDGSVRHQYAATVALDVRRGPVRLTFDGGYIRYTVRGQGLNYTLAVNATLPAPPDPRRRVTPLWATFKDRSWYYVGGAEVDVADWLTLTARAGGSRQEMDSNSFFVNPIDSLGQTTAGQLSYRPWSNTETVTELGARAQFETGPLSHNLVVSGLRLTGGNTSFGVVNVANSSSPNASIYEPYPGIDPFPTGFPARIIIPAVQPRLSSIAVVDDIAAFDARLRVILGARHQRIEQAPYDQSRTTPTVAALLKPAARLSIYANYAQALSQGAVAPVGTVNAGEQLPPYVSTQYEVGAKYDGGGFGVTLAAFQIAQDFALTDTFNRFVIGAQQRNRGVELEAFGEVVKGLRILGGIAYIDAIQSRTATGGTTGRKALGVPEWSINLGADYDIAALPGLTLGARFLHTDKTFINLTNTQVVPRWERLDATARYRFAAGGGKWTLRAGVTNIFDGRYWQTGGRNIIVVGSPRTWFTSLSADF